MTTIHDPVPTRDPIPTTTTRIVLPGVVEPDGLQVTTAPVTAPDPGQLLVAVAATGVSYAEQSMRRGRYYAQPPFPFIPGYDLVGTVLAAGSARDAGLVGRRVASLTKTGAWAGHALVAARDTFEVPADVRTEDAEAVVTNGLTAWQMLHRAARVRPGGTVLLFGASGGVGGLLIQLAHHHDVRVVAAARPDHHEALRATGATPVDYTDPDLLDTVRHLAPGGLAAVFDNVASPATRATWHLLARGGAMVTYAVAAASRGDGSPWPPFLSALGLSLVRQVLPNGRRATFYDLWAGHRTRPARYRRHLAHDLGRVLDLVADGTVRPAIAARYPLDQAGAALAHAEDRTTPGKVVLLP